MKRKRHAKSIALALVVLLSSLGASATERGAITAIASLNTQLSAFVGFATGEVFYCNRLSGCTQLEGTPDSAVTSLDAPGDGDTVRAWVGYENGSLYFCTLTAGCVLQELSSHPARSKLPS
ncbi:MAG: hypothetical protein R3E64_02520 [Halioglobus sp.]